VAHNVAGSIGLVVNGTLFNQVDELLGVTIIIMVGLLSYVVVYELRHRERLHRDGWWLRARIERQAS
jgi:hypothetical protein